MELPNGWAWTTLGNLGQYINGRGFKKSEWSTAGRPIIRIQNLTGSGTDFNYFAGDLEQRYVVKPGDLLISWAATLGAYIWSGPESALNQHIFKVESAIDKTFHRYLIDYKLAELMQETHGSGMVHVTRGRFDNLQIALPPLSEQRRIVEALEDHLSRLDAACSIIRANLRRCRALEAAVIDQAVRGVLMSHHEPVDEISPYAQELSRLRRSMSSGRTTPKLASSPLAMTIPTNWTTMSLDELTWSIEYGTSAKAHSDSTPGDVPVIRMGNIQNRELDYSSLKYLPASHPDVQKLSLTDGDILFNRTNSAELVGKSAVYRSDSGPATFASYLIRCRVLPGVEPDWLNLVINSPVGRSYLRSVVSQQVGQANINGTKLATMPIPLPTPQEQRAILEVVDDYLGKHNRLTKALTSSLQRAEHLRKSLLLRAFSGELVSQDPTEEPAIEFLKTIEAERGVRVKTTRGHRASTAPLRRTTYVSAVMQEELPL
ncbi:restriction endonuclease subunit S [Dactylosporangium sp. NPDC005555]|uniref:restriction endonuclease subunit S n=1 Tax=Dactylosporangium sp. NPDC005555 TaxID=3154889 RepID=UPI0033AAAF78